MTDPTLTVSIDRTSLSLAALVFSATLDANALGIVAYQPPSMQSRLAYMPDSFDVNGSEAIGASWQQAILGFDWVRDNGATETQVQASYAEVLAAIGQFAFPVTTQVSGAPAQVWSANRGSMSAAPRTYSDLTYRNPVYAVTIPVYPIAS